MDKIDYYDFIYVDGCESFNCVDDNFGSDFVVLRGNGDDLKGLICFSFVDGFDDGLVFVKGDGYDY